MKIIYYCQQIWGVGHLFRTREIIRALSGHRLTLVLGGPAVEVTLPSWVKVVQLPGIKTDRNYKGLHPVDDGISLEEVKDRRRQQLARLFEDETPDFFIIELFPFGRRAFRFELTPILENLRQENIAKCRVFCSLRDILVEKKDADAFEKDVVGRLNQHFDGLLIHADDKLQDLGETFGRMAEIKIPYIYTGFVAPTPAPGAGPRMRQKLKISANEGLIVASAGGGKMGAKLLPPVVEAFKRLKTKRPYQLYIFSGPFMPQKDYLKLVAKAGDGIFVERFTDQFLELMAAADLSISMAGYNTCMNILTTRVKALVWPFPGDREQGLRAGKLQALDVLNTLDKSDLEPDRLAKKISMQLAKRSKSAPVIDLDGAANTRRWLDTYSDKSLAGPKKR